MYKIKIQSETQVFLMKEDYSYYDITIEGDTIVIRKARFDNDQIAVYPEGSNKITII